MKAIIRWGAVTLLVLMAMPILATAGLNPALCSAAWWGVAYVVCRMIFPASKRPLAAPIAICVGLLSLSVLAVTAGQFEAPLTSVEIAAVCALLVWLYIASGVLPAALLIAWNALQTIVVIALNAGWLDGGSVSWWFIASLATQRAFAIFLLWRVIQANRTEPAREPRI